MERIRQDRPAGRATTIVVWIVTILVALLFFRAGLPKVLGIGGWGPRFANWGYPPWFVGVTGVLEIAGAVLLLSPRTAVLGAATLAAVMLGAAATHLVHGETARLVVPAILCLALGAVAWMRRTRA